MHCVLRFSTDLFDVSKESTNSINPIPGQSLLLWLQTRAGDRLVIPSPDAEDWGWCTYVEWQGARYMLGASASEEDDGPREWILQIEKQSSLWKKLQEKLKGTSTQDVPDSCVAFLHALLAAEPRFVGLILQRNP